MGVPYTLEQLKKLGLIEVDGIYVKSSSQVAKGKVDKIEPGFKYDSSKTRVIGSLNTNEDGTIWVDYFSIPEPTPEEFMHRFKEQGFIYTKPIPQGEYYQLPTGEQIQVKYKFEIKPQPAPRMTKSDIWKTDPFHADPLKRQRPPVTRYFKWQRDFIALANKSGYTLQETLRVLFIMPMPKYLSIKKCEMKLGQPHKQRPDTDNMMKSIKDVFKSDDGFVWDERGVKVWGEIGMIIIF